VFNFVYVRYTLLCFSFFRLMEMVLGLICLFIVWVFSWGWDLIGGFFGGGG